MKLATWNIRKCVGLDRRRDPRRVARVIANMSADVVVLQEADKRLGRRPAALSPEIVRSETGLEPVDVGGHETSLGWHGNAVLLAPDLFVKGVQQIDLPGMEPRGAVMVDIEGPNQELRIVAVHLGLLRSSRKAQLSEVRRAIDASDAKASVILGDYNEWSPHKGLEALQGFDVHAPGRSFHAARPVAALDRIATSSGLALEDAGVVETEVTRVASDHLPVWAKISTAA